MATRVKELREWLSHYPDHWLVWVDEGGLTLETGGQRGKLTYCFELGGRRTDDSEEDDE